MLLMLVFFLLFYTLIYGGAHYWFFTRLIKAYALTQPVSLSLIILFVSMFLAPITVFILERHHWENLGRILAWISYIWMGCLFLIFSSYVLLSLIKGLWLLFPTGTFLSLPQPWRSAFWTTTITLGLTLLGLCFSLWEAQHTQVDKITITTAKMPKGKTHFRLVQISDLHLGVMSRTSYIQKVVDLISAQKPDAILCTGDLLDAQVDNCSQYLQPLYSLNAPAGKYAILGNHELYVGIEKSVKLLEQMGFYILRGEGKNLQDVLYVVGVDDTEGPRFNAQRRISDTEALQNVPENKFIVFLKHRPVVDKNARTQFDLQLSGHTHKGQLFPFHLFTRLAFRYHGGYYPLSQQAAVYVSRGTGTWGPPMRLFSPPEITVIDIFPQNQ